MSSSKQPLASLRTDLPASIVVALVALPLCLGVALASGAPLFSGLIAGIVGGIVVGGLSRSPLSVSGPAAGLTVIVLDTINSLPSYPIFLSVVVLAGALQLAFSTARAGILSEFIPSSVITGMLASIGLILVLKQIPFAIGYEVEAEGGFQFSSGDGNTFTNLFVFLRRKFEPGALIISLAGLAFLFWWNSAKPKQGPLRFLPGPLVAVLIGVIGNALLGAFLPSWKIGTEHLVQVPVSKSPAEFAQLFSLPDFSGIGSSAVWIAAATIAIVASLESMLSIKAIDELDPQRRTTDKNWELMAQGGGNIVSGLLGGLPVTSVIVRSSANVGAGAQSKASTMLHGLWLLLSVALIPMVLNLIPLAALAAVLIATGYKLCTPQLFLDRYRQGWTQFIPFVVTVIAIMFTNLLEGVLIGLVIGFVFVIARNFRSAVTFACEGNDCLIRARRNLYFIHKYELQKQLNRVPENSRLLIDLSATSYVDLDNVEIINSFIKAARFKSVDVVVRGDLAERTSPLINAPVVGVRFA